MENIFTPPPSDIIGGADVSTEGIPLSTVLIIVLIVAAVACVVALVHYVLFCWGLYRIAKKLCVENAFLAWIPYAQYYTLGAVAERCDERSGKVFPRPWAKIVLFGTLGAMAIMVVLYTVNFICSFFPMIGVLIALLSSLLVMVLAYAPLVLDSICRWKIYREFFPETVNIVLFIVGIVFNVQAIITLVASFRQPNDIEKEYIENVMITYND